MSASERPLPGGPHVDSQGANPPDANQDVAPASRMLRDTLKLSAGLGAAQLILWGITPVWARLYGPQDFALLGLWSAVVAVVSIVLPLRYDSAVVPAASEQSARGLVRLVLLLCAVGGLALSALAWALPQGWRAALGQQALGAALPLSVAAGAGAAAVAAALAWANRQALYGRMGLVRVILALSTAALGVLLATPEGALPQTSPTSAAAGWLSTSGLLLAHAGAAVVGLALLPWLLQGRLLPASPVAQVAKAHADAPRFLWPAALLDAFSQQLPLWLIVAWFSHEQAGQFSLAWRVLALPAFTLASAAGSVFYQRFAQIWAQPARSQEQAKTLLTKQWRQWLWMGVVPTLLVLALGPALFAWAFGSAWREAGVLAAAMAPMLLAMLVSSPTSGALIVLGLQRYAPAFGLAMVVYRPAAFALGAWAGSLVWALLAWALAEVLAIALYNRLIWRAVASHGQNQMRAA